MTGTGPGPEVREQTAAEHAGEREAVRRTAILEAARSLFQRYGYKKTTVEEIARAAEITKPTVYAYFDGKEDILLSLVEWEGRAIIGSGLDRLDESAGATEQLDSMFVSVDDFLSEDSFLKGIVTRDPDVVTPEVIRVAYELQGRIVETVEKIVERGMREGTFRETDARLMAYALVRMYEAFNFTAFFELEGYDRDRVNEFFMETVAAVLQHPDRPISLPADRRTLEAT